MSPKQIVISSKPLLTGHGFYDDYDYFIKNKFRSSYVIAVAIVYCDKQYFLNIT